MSNSFDLQFEKAVRILAQYMPLSDETSRKPIMFHDIRVGMYLYERGYLGDIVLAGLLHDVLEWSDASENMIRDEFGDTIMSLIQVNTKDDTIVDGNEKINELIQRCVQSGKDALIIKTADILDSFAWYWDKKNENELQRHCVKTAKSILRYKPEDWNDAIFDELRVWQERCENAIFSPKDRKREKECSTREYL